MHRITKTITPVRLTQTSLNWTQETCDYDENRFMVRVKVYFEKQESESMLNQQVGINLWVDITFMVWMHVDSLIIRLRIFILTMETACII